MSSRSNWVLIAIVAITLCFGTAAATHHPALDRGAMRSGFSIPNDVTAATPSPDDQQIAARLKPDPQQEAQPRLQGDKTATWLPAAELSAAISLFVSAFITWAILEIRRRRDATRAPPNKSREQPEQNTDGNTLLGKSEDFGASETAGKQQPTLDILGAAMALLNEKYPEYRRDRSDTLSGLDVNGLVDACIGVLKERYAVLGRKDIDDLRGFLEANVRRQLALENELAHVIHQAKQDKLANEEFQRATKLKLETLSQPNGVRNNADTAPAVLPAIRPAPSMVPFGEPSPAIQAAAAFQPERLFDIFAAADGGSAGRARARFDRLIEGLPVKTTQTLIEAMFRNETDGLPPLRVRGALTGGWDIAWSMPDLQRDRLTSILREYGYEAIWPEAHDLVNMDRHRVTGISADQHAQGEIVALLRPGLYRIRDGALIRRADVTTSD